MRAVLLTLVVAAALAGCGGDDTQSTSATPAPPPMSSDTPTATPSATPSPTPTATVQPSPTPTPTSAEDQPGGAGDEEAIRVPAEFTISPGLKISPQQIAIPAFLQIEFIVHNRSDQPVDVSWVTGKLMTVQPHDNASTTVPGRKKGSYVVTANPGGDAVIITGAKPGP